MTQHSAVTCDDGAMYLLGELSPDQTREFLKHMEQCNTCKLTYDEVWPVHEALTVPVVTPEDAELARSMKSRILANVLASAQDAVTTVATVQTPMAPTLASAKTRARRRPFRRSLQWMPVAAALLVGVLVGISSHGSFTTSPPAYSELIREVPMHATAMAPTAQGMVMMVQQGHTHQMIISVHGLAPLPEGQCYNVWYVQPNGTRTLAGMLTVDANGAGALSAQVPQIAFVSVGITKEPHLNDMIPQGPKMMGAPISNA